MTSHLCVMKVKCRFFNHNLHGHLYHAQKLGDALYDFLHTVSVVWIIWLFSVWFFACFNELYIENSSFRIYTYSLQELKCGKVITKSLWSKDIVDNLFWLLFKVIFNRRIIVLQNCVGFCHRAMWISHTYTYAPSLLNPLLPCTSSPFSVVPEQQVEFPVLYNSFLLSLCFTYGYVCVLMLLSQFIPPSPSSAGSEASSLCLHFYSCPENRFISTTYLDSTYLTPGRF